MQRKPFQKQDNAEYNIAKQAVLNALCVLEREDVSLVAAVLKGEFSAEKIRTLITEKTAGWDAKAARQQLLNSDPARYHLLSERAVTVLEAEIATQPQVEETLVMVAEHWGNQLLVENLAQFGQLVARLRRCELQSDRGQQLGDFFAAAFLARSAEFDHALEALNTLLNSPTLTPYIRARSLNARAICQRVLGHPERAMDDYNASLVLWRAIGDRHYEAITLTNIATVANGSLQQPQRSIVALEKAAIIFNEIDDAGWLAAVHNNLGIVHHDLGEWEKALHFSRLSLERRRFEGAAEQIGSSLLNIAEISLYQGELEAATAAFDEALPHLSNRLYLIDAKIGSGLIAQAGGRLAAARVQYGGALTLAIEIGRNEILPLVHYRLADLLRRMEDDEAAFTHLVRAVGLIEQSRTPLRAEAIKISLLGRWQQVYEALILLCVENGRDAEAFAWAERARARAYMEGIEGNSAETVSLSDLQASLNDNHVLLNYFTTGVVERDIPLLKNLPRNNQLRAHLLLPARILRFDISRVECVATICPLDPNVLTSGSARVQDGQRFLEPGIKGVLAKALLPGESRAASFWKAGSSTFEMTIIPHGPLHQVPFAALFETLPALSFAPSATIFARRGLVDSAESDCLAVAYNGSGDRAAVLQFAEREADLVKDIIGGSATDSKVSLREEAHSKRYLHFACHGWFDFETPLASYLEVGDRVKLTAREIMDEWSISAELVTLSACQTGISQVLRSDEPMGLIRAFLYAGARAVLVTQWSVEDLPTFLFMGEFYRRVERGKGKGESSGLALVLRDVQAWLRGLSSAEIAALCDELDISPSPPLPVSPSPFSHPRHWAAFTLVGA